MKNFINNTITIQFVHRGIAYLIFVLIACWTIAAFRIKNAIPLFIKWRYIPLLLVTVQILLGILSVINSPLIVPSHWGTFEWMALLHQIVGMLLLLSIVLMLYLLTPKYQTQQL